jgi:hypothetical protein
MLAQKTRYKISGFPTADPRRGWSRIHATLGTSLPLLSVFFSSASIGAISPAKSRRNASDSCRALEPSQPGMNGPGTILTVRPGNLDYQFILGPARCEDARGDHIGTDRAGNETAGMSSGNRTGHKAKNASRTEPKEAASPHRPSRQPENFLCLTVTVLFASASSHRRPM